MSITHCFMGWNTNIDAIIHLNNGEDVQKCYDVLFKADPATAELFLQTIPKGVAHEALVPPSVTKALTDNFESEFVIAGQGGFFLRNVISSFPELVPVLHLPNRAPMLMDMLKKLSEKIQVFSETGLEPIANVNADATMDPPVHAVVEYNAGLSFTTADGRTVQTPRNNRFIFTFDVTNSNLHLDQLFLKNYKKIVDNKWLFLLSGYHLLTENVINPDFEAQHEKLLAEIQQTCGHLHFELAFTNVEKARVLILEKLLKSVQSVGLNEIELKMFAEEDKIVVESEVERLKLFTDKIQVPVMLFHTLGKYIALNHSKNEYKFEAGFKKAEKVVLETRRVASSVEFSVTYPEEDKCAGMIHYSPKLLKPISSSVGLGDTISSSIVLGMMQ
ncbi:ADP-dependent_glucokinase / ADP-specific phosphofructokinase [Hexamita inflata]|uniref:ADP-dependent glucokinase / ADP-specific phosphofructokinase n=1 Tax=Hexamita inflata TaxID=28002 RepID=A0AA86NGW5_9EUKA|nr:ADP-dependent glucokinase / ADP-specific phosphofructokinase [Hexamita inflata]